MKKACIAASLSFVWLRTIALWDFLPLPPGEGWGEGMKNRIFSLSLHPPKRFLKEEISFDPPHPNPLPVGEGTKGKNLHL
jgi:hypothetical protein